MGEEFDFPAEILDRLDAARKLAVADHQEFVRRGGSLSYNEWLKTLDIPSWCRSHGIEDLIPYLPAKHK